MEKLHYFCLLCMSARLFVIWAKMFVEDMELGFV